MQRSPVVVGLAAVFVGLTTLLLLVAVTTGSPVVFVVAIPLALTAAIMWYHATGRLAERTRRRARRAARAGATRGDGGAAAGGHAADGRGGFGATAGVGELGDDGAPGAAGRRARRACGEAGTPPPGWYEDAGGRRWYVDGNGHRWRVGPNGEVAGRGNPGGPGRGRTGGDRRAAGASRPGSAVISDATARKRLGVAADADEDAIEAAYRETVKEVHPDTADGDAESFKRVTEAYERLVD